MLSGANLFCSCQYQNVLARKREINLSTFKILLLSFNKLDFIFIGLNAEKLVLLYAPDVCTCLIMSWQLFVQQLVELTTKRTSKLPVIGPLWRNAQVADIIRSQRDSIEESVNIPWQREVLHSTIPIPSYPRLLRMRNLFVTLIIDIIRVHYEQYLSICSWMDS